MQGLNFNIFFDIPYKKGKNKALFDDKCIWKEKIGNEFFAYLRQEVQNVKKDSRCVLSCKDVFKVRKQKMANCIYKTNVNITFLRLRQNIFLLKGKTY